ncbi:GNAT family N-acetyltransferase [Halocynthiibacter namhaensis]|uniref:GNAT family N-acetyltransferase n=1 Tax=Halocynthiibacter namhaensis TaxID=1290553 RepID=UPI0006893FCD|nr:GNAT family N-acetyltransferase [Halocynthiibacter namhaensis]
MNIEIPTSAEVSTTQMIIETERFTLRPAQKSDTGLIEMHGSDIRVARNTASIPHPYPPGAADAFVARANAADRTEDLWVLDGSKSGHAEVIGVISSTRQDMGTRMGKQSEISYWIAPAFWNSGMASEAVNAILQANPQDCDTVFAAVFQDNPASARVLTNAGFAYIGDAENYSVARMANVATWTYVKKLK